jgi:uncharacterized membrane protein YfcA
VTHLEQEFIQAQKDLVGLVKKLRSERYLQMVDRPRKFIFLHFIAGMASGLGGALGATVILALIFFVLSKLQVVPILGNFITEIIEVVEENLRYRR